MIYGTCTGYLDIPGMHSAVGTCTAVHGGSATSTAVPTGKYMYQYSGGWWVAGWLGGWVAGWVAGWTGWLGVSGPGGRVGGIGAMMS